MKYQLAGLSGFSIDVTRDSHMFYSLLREVNRQGGATSILPRLLTRIAAIDNATRDPQWVSNNGATTRGGIIGLTKDIYVGGCALLGQADPGIKRIFDPYWNIRAAVGYFRQLETRPEFTKRGTRYNAGSVIAALTGMTDSTQIYDRLDRYTALLPDSQFDLWYKIYRSGVSPGSFYEANPSLWITSGSSTPKTIPAPPKKTPGTVPGGSDTPATPPAPRGGFWTDLGDNWEYLALAGVIVGGVWYAHHEKWI